MPIARRFSNVSGRDAAIALVIVGLIAGSWLLVSRDDLTTAGPVTQNY